jgi:hypothetical protein
MNPDRPSRLVWFVLVAFPFAAVAVVVARGCGWQ